jgi:peroxiredoxin
VSDQPGPGDAERPPPRDSERSPPPDSEPRLLTRLDPDRARSGRESEPASGDGGDSPRPPGGGPPIAISTRRYRWIIGGFGLTLVLAISVFQFATHGVGTTGVPPGKRLHWFAAPLANSSLIGDPNLSPPCTLARHDPRALNVCLDARREPLVLSLFVAGSAECVRQVDALQQLAGQFPARKVQFAAVAVDASRAATASLIRIHHWTIPVAYDRDGSVAALYGVAICPMAELAYRGGIVRARLIGDRWQTTAALAPEVRALLDRTARSS